MTDQSLWRKVRAGEVRVESRLWTMHEGLSLGVPSLTSGAIRGPRGPCTCIGNRRPKLRGQNRLAFAELRTLGAREARVRLEELAAG